MAAKAYPPGMSGTPSSPSNGSDAVHRYRQPERVPAVAALWSGLGIGIADAGALEGAFRVPTSTTGEMEHWRALLLARSGAGRMAKASKIGARSSLKGG
jgi:hypothetical protein